MLPPDGLWTTDSAVVRYNATDKASQSVFWENELLSTEKLLEEIVKKTFEYVEKRHQKGLRISEAIPKPAVELKAVLNVKFQSTSDVIAAKAEETNASMIGVVQYKKSWFTKLMLGQGVSQSVLKKASCPTLVYHAGYMKTEDEKLEEKAKESKMPGGEHASQTKL